MSSKLAAAAAVLVTRPRWILHVAHTASAVVSREKQAREHSAAWVALAALVLVSACSSPPPERLSVDGRTVTVLNDSGREWRSVEIWVNDYYRVTRDRIAPGERFQAPLNVFVAGFGQRFPAHQQVTGVEVTATDSAGEAVRLVLGSGRRR